MMRIQAKLKFSIGAVAACFAASCATIDDDLTEQVESEVITQAPQNVTATPTKPDRVMVSWDAVPGATKYYIYNAASAAGPFTFVQTERAPNTSSIVAHLTANTTYCWQVAADDGTTNGIGPASVSTCGGTPTAPAAPTHIAATPITATDLEVLWTPTSGATKYYLYEAPSQNGTYTFLGTTTTSETHRTITAGSVHCYKVKVETANGISPLSIPHCNNNSAQAPTGVTAVRVNSTRIKIDWVAAAGATKYYVWESIGPGTYHYRATAPNPPGGVTLTATGLTTGQLYCYRVQTQGSPDVNRSSLSLPEVCATP